MEFTKEEQVFLKNILSSLQVNPSNKDAGKTVELVQSIIVKLTDTL